jgi:DNA ligase-1
VLFADLAAASRAVAATRSRKEKIRLLCDVLRRTGDAERPLAVAYLSGIMPQGRIGVGYAMLRDLTAAPAPVPSLTIGAIDETLSAIAMATGPGSQTVKRELITALLGRATAAEQDLLLGLLGGEIRQGALDGVMIEAIAAAFAIPADLVRRAAMFGGDLASVARVAAAEGEAGLAALRLRLFSPIRPMLASVAADAASAVTAVGDAIVDWKVDGARVQVHRSGSRIRVFTRNLREVTGSLPGTVAAVAALPGTSMVLDGEVATLDPSGRPRAFQETMKDFGRSGPPAAAHNDSATFVFDCLHLDGEDLVDLPLHLRLARLDAVLPDEMRVPRLRTRSGEEAGEFFAAALAAGYEGVMVKAAASHYTAGRRGAEWLKVKPAHTLDLVILAAEWGSGRRRGTLSNLHLGAYDPATGHYVMLGKTFKGLTDEMLAWQTQRLLELEDRREGRVVHVRPELVAEIACDGVQDSPRYPGGVALRFARVKGYRPDKRPDEADTIATVRALRHGARR